MQFTKNFDRIFFIIVLVALVAFSFLLYKRIQELIDSYNQVNHTNVVQLKLESTFSNIKDAESAQRGYLVTNDPAFLDPFNGSHKRTDSLLAELNDLTKDNSEQQANISELKRLTDIRFARLERSLNIYKTLSSNEVHERLLTGKLIMDSIRRQVSKMEQVEDNLLKQREKIRDQNLSITPFSVLLLVILSLLILLFYFVRMTRQLNITKEYADQLETKNIQLEKSNEELNSFNYIASHDLREPLRKIRTYNSILSNDQSKFKEYSEKIEFAINRMQNLLNDLLSYSRISMEERIEESVDLNKVVAEVCAALTDQIEETGARIDYDNLPEIRGFHFQLQQLFENLISNSIKYRRDDIAPLVKIYCKRINKNELPQAIEPKHEYYYLIQVTDNGIGFDQKYADKVFELFQRLHSRNTYSGTGIGLTICRKIVENHNGFISASSAIGKGSKFFVYLPA